MPLNQLKSKCVAAPDVLLIRSCLAWSLESLKVPLSCQKTLSLCMCVCTKDGKRVGEKTKGESAGKGGVKCHVGNHRAREHRYRGKARRTIGRRISFL